MRTRTLAMMLMLLVAGLAIGCSSTPLPTYTPYPTYTPAAAAALVPNLTENEAIGIARSYQEKHRISLNLGPCFSTKGPDYEHTNFRHTESASFKASRIWVVTARTAWGDMTNFDNIGGWLKPSSDYITDEYPCTYVVDDATGKVT